MQTDQAEPNFVAIDPGSSKCGYAIFSDGKAVARGIVAPEDIGMLKDQYGMTTMIFGDRTGGGKILDRLAAAGGLKNTRVWLVDENLSSAEGRRRFLAAHRTGWRRFWPLGLQSPSQPYDDFVAVILGERFLDPHYNRRLWQDKNIE